MGLLATLVVRLILPVYGWLPRHCSNHDISQEA